MEKIIEKIFNESISAQETFIGDPACVSSVVKAAGILIDCYKKGGKVLVFGNGGSAADSQHMAAELVVRFEKERRPLPCIALSADTANITAAGNDYNFDAIFSRQVEALGAPGDVVIAISTSGVSPNIIQGALAAKKKNMPVIALTGRSGGKLAPLADVAIIVKSEVTARIQEVHIVIIHALCKLIEESVL